MASSSAATPDEYIASLPEDRRAAIAAVRRVVRDNLPAGYREGMQFGMIGWYVPHHMSLYLNAVYGDPATERWFRERYAASGKRLDMGKSCVRFRRLEDLPLDVIGATIARADLDAFVAGYERARGSSRATRAVRAATGDRDP